jgi:hypothetical protein
LSTFETVCRDTCASRATSSTVGSWGTVQTSFGRRADGFRSIAELA